MHESDASAARFGHTQDGILQGDVLQVDDKVVSEKDDIGRYFTSPPPILFPIQLGAYVWTSLTSSMMLENRAKTCLFDFELTSHYCLLSITLDF